MKNLTEKPVSIQWPKTHYAFIEKIGPFEDTAQAAWTLLHERIPDLAQTNRITGFMSLYRFEPQMTYRAGVSLEKKPENLPTGMRYEEFPGGSYSKFTLVGSYSQLPEASGRVFEIVSETEMPMLDDAYCIENYVNDPKTTPEEKLVTEILIPVSAT